MAHLLIHWFVSALVLMVVAYLLKGFEVRSFMSALVAAVLIGGANLLFRPFLLLITLPINILTLGLFTWVINAFILKICGSLTSGFVVKTWGAAFMGALLIAVFNALVYWLMTPSPQYI